MKHFSNTQLDVDHECAKILQLVTRGRTVRLTNRFDDGRIVTTFKPNKYHKVSHNCEITVKLSVYEGTALADVARKDQFVALTAVADSIAAAFAERLNQLCPA